MSITDDLCATVESSTDTRYSTGVFLQCPRNHTKDTKLSEFVLLESHLTLIHGVRSAYGDFLAKNLVPLKRALRTIASPPLNRYCVGHS